VPISNMFIPSSSAYRRKPKQVDGWRLVTDAVHVAGGRILLQLWHCGRMSHESLHPGRQPVAPVHCGVAFTDS